MATGTEKQLYAASRPTPSNIRPPSLVSILLFPDTTYLWSSSVHVHNSAKAVLFPLHITRSPLFSLHYHELTQATIM